MKQDYEKRYQILLTKLRQAREAAGLSQEEAGKLLGRNQSYISRCESGERRLDVIELLEFAELYNVAVAILLSFEGA